MLVGQAVAVLLGHLAATEAAGRAARTYLQIRIVGAPLALLYVALREVRYAEGDAQSPMRATVAAQAVNILLAVLFIFVLKQGVRGAACATVISVHYRRAPEHPLPAAHRDACAAARWALAHAGQLGADPARLVLAGDSAGGGLAAHVAQRLRDEGPAPAALQVLCYPASDFSLARADREAAHARLLDWETIEWFAAHSMPGWSDSQRRDPSISPLYADRLGGLPPALVITAGVDPFRSDGIAYCRALSEAGVSAIHRDFPGQIHGFAGMDLIFPAAGDALRQAADAIARVRPVDARTAVSAVPEPILWDRVVTDRLRRMGDTAQRLPQVNGARVLATLADHHARAALATLVSLSRHGSPRAPDSQRTIP